MRSAVGRTMSRPALLAVVAGIVLLATVMISLDETPTVLESRSTMEARFRAAAQGARSWAAQAFGNSAAAEEHQTELSPQREAPAMFHSAAQLRSMPSSQPEITEHRPVVRSVRGTELSSRDSGGSDEQGFYNDALAQLGAPPSMAQLNQRYGDASFASDAQSQLPPAPQLSSLHRSSHHTHRAEDDADADAFSAEGRRQQLAQGQYGLAPEEKGSITGEAQEFGAQLQRMRESKEEAATKAHATAAKQRLIKKRANDLGIPEGRDEGFHVTRYASAPRAKKMEEKRREQGLSSHDADQQLMSYFSDLVKDSRDKKQHRPAHRYFRTRDQARQESLSEITRAAPKPRARSVRPRDLHVSEYAAAENALGKAPVPHVREGRKAVRAEGGEGGRKEARGGLSPEAKEELQARLDAAYKTIETLTKEEEKRLVKRTRSTVLKAEEKLGGLPHSKQSLALNPLAGGGAKGLKDAVEDRLAAKAVEASSNGASAAALDAKRHPGSAALRSSGMSSEEARADLFSSMDSQFERTKEQDKLDRMKLHSLAPKQADQDILNYLKDQGQASHEQNLKDMRHLAHPFHTDPRVQIRREERDKSLEEENEYESALRDALKQGPVPNRPVPTH